MAKQVTPASALVPIYGRREEHTRRTGIPTGNSLVISRAGTADEAYGQTNRTGGHGLPQRLLADHLPPPASSSPRC
jgi:hypothetical protein